MTDNKIQNSSGSETLNQDELAWIQLRKEIGAANMQNEETFKSKFQRKFYENPFVPIGCGLTSMALIYGLWSFRKGRQRMSQNMMRLRIGAQGFTIVALMVGVGISATEPLEEKKYLDKIGKRNEKFSGL